jgi:hypothetical protein
VQGVHAFEPKAKTSIDLESFVAADHFLRRIDRVLDLSFLRELTAPICIANCVNYVEKYKAFFVCQFRNFRAKFLRAFDAVKCNRPQMRALSHGNSFLKRVVFDRD